MFAVHTAWMEKPCYYVSAVHGFQYRLLAGPYRDKAIAAAAIDRARDWAVKESGDEKAGLYHYQVFRTDHGHNRSILGMIEP
jgi:hypothetical protein